MDDVVTFDHVEVTHETIFGMMCTIAGRTVVVGGTVPAPGTMVQRVGDVGHLGAADALISRDVPPSGDQTTQVGLGEP
jgi:hypothetical protein